MSIQLSLRSNDSYPFVNSPTFVVGDNIFHVTKGKSKDYAWFNLTCNHAPSPGTPPEICNFFIPLPRAQGKRQFPTPELLIDLIYVFWYIFVSCKSTTRRFHNFYNSC